MNKKTVIANIALMVAFFAVGISLFTENVRTVQIIGLFACGMGVGASLTNIIAALKSKKNKE